MPAAPEPDSGPAHTAPADAGDADSGVDAGASCHDEDAGACCETDADCDDGVRCNGQERCIAGACAAGVSTCPPEHPCIPATDTCDCSDPDHDDDDFAAEACGGGDCDDRNAFVHPNAIEVCDVFGVDEDCEPNTAGQKDDDGDGYVAQECRNLGGENNGDDCDDRNPFAHPYRTEECDGYDNNCNGYTDERFLDGVPDEVSFGLREPFYVDTDGDGYAGPSAELTMLCPHPAPKHLVGADSLGDCKEEDPDVNPDAEELCDGQDNDCDDLTDEEDPDLHKPDFTDTEIACQDGSFAITRCPRGKLWCDTATVQYGCDVDGTRMTSCGQCVTDCKFSCGHPDGGDDFGCDEIATLALGREHSCALTAGGVAACWGRGGRGRLGDDTSAGSSEPKPVALPPTVTMIAAGQAHSCAVAGERRQLLCWGENSDKQLGTQDSEQFSEVPVAVLGETGELDGVVSVALGVQHSCAVLYTGEALCWGQTADGRLGEGSALEGSVIAPVNVQREVYFDLLGYAVPAAVDDARAIAAGSRHSCMITTADTVRCWGDNSYGQLGDDSTAPQSVFANDVAGLENVTRLAAGRHHTCAIASGEVYCWGNNQNGQLGRATSGDDDVPLPVPGLSDVEELALGVHFSCALTRSGSVVCWGLKTMGQLGLSAQEPSTDPIEVTSGAKAIAAGDGHICFVSGSLGQTYCWGENSYGQLGEGLSTLERRAAPVPVRPLRGDAR